MLQWIEESSSPPPQQPSPRGNLRGSTKLPTLDPSDIVDLTLNEESADAQTPALFSCESTSKPQSSTSWLDGLSPDSAPVVRLDHHPLVASEVIPTTNKNSEPDLRDEVLRLKTMLEEQAKDRKEDRELLLLHAKTAIERSQDDTRQDKELAEYRMSFEMLTRQILQENLHLKQTSVEHVNSIKTLEKHAEELQVKLDLLSNRWMGCWNHG